MFLKSTEELSCLIQSIAKDLPKVYKGNKEAMRRIRCATIELSKLSKQWRKLSLNHEKNKG